MKRFVLGFVMIFCLVMVGCAQKEEVPEEKKESSKSQNAEKLEPGETHFVFADQELTFEELNRQMDSFELGITAYIACSELDNMGIEYKRIDEVEEITGKKQTYIKFSQPYYGFLSVSDTEGLYDVKYLFDDYMMTGLIEPADEEKIKSVEVRIIEAEGEPTEIWDDGESTYVGYQMDGYYKTYSIYNNEVRSLIKSAEKYVEEKTVLNTEGSAKYSDEEINAAIEIITREFEQKWKGCTLTQIGYAGDEKMESCQDWADRMNADEVMVLNSSFDVDASGGDGSLNPNSTYDNWYWILVRNIGDEWKYVDHGCC